MKKLTGLLLLLTLLGCGTSGKESTYSDSLATNEVLAQQAALAYDKGDYFFLNDSIWTKVASVRELDVPTFSDQYYSSKDIKDGSLGYYTKRFFELDSIYKISKEPQFDIGETIKVNIHFMDTLYSTSDFTVCTWLLQYESYPACPSSAGIIANLSTFDKSGKLISTATIGEESGAADAPVYMNTSTETKVFKNGKIEIKETVVNGGPAEEDPEAEEELIETVVSSQDGSIDAMGIITLKIKKELSKSTKKQKYN